MELVMEDDDKDEGSELACPARRGGSGLLQVQQQQGQGEQPALAAASAADEVEGGGGGWSDSDDSDGMRDGGLAGFERGVRFGGCVILSVSVYLCTITCV